MKRRELVDVSFCRSLELDVPAACYKSDPRFAGRRDADNEQQRAVSAQHEPEQYSRLEATVRVLDVVAARHRSTAAGWLQHGKTTTPHLPEPERTTTTTNTLSITPATGTAFPLTLRRSVRIFTKLGSVRAHLPLFSRLFYSFCLSLFLSHFLTHSLSLSVFLFPTTPLSPYDNSTHLVLPLILDATIYFRFGNFDLQIYK